ncbi:energy transducer TonB [Pedobacter frigoris]|uniref:energy transducer TonB n=1 Tax=Pedobacter frigoris TaxID=2571272 RepID=UPI00292F7CEC|nr:energy transducer TonB [Pedobacter frigoris]
MNSTFNALLSTVFLSFFFKCTFAQETQKVSRTQTNPNYTINEKYSVLKANPEVKHGLYSASISRYSELGEYDHDKKIGVWECFDDGKLVQRYDFGSQTFLLGAETKMIVEVEQLDDQGNLVRKLITKGVYFGGDAKLSAIMLRSMRYPADAQQNDIQGTVIIDAIISKEGNVIKEKAITNIGYGLEQEALRVFKSLPSDWVPTIVDGKAVDVKVKMKMSFRLSHLPAPKG